MKKPAMLIPLLLASLTLGQTRPAKIKMHHTAKDMRRELEKQIPIGSSITGAQQILQANGFRCTLKQQQSFVEMTDNKSILEHSNIDFLLCDKSDHLLVNTRFWQVAVLHQGGVVVDLLSTVAKSPVLRKKDYISMSDEDIRNVLFSYAPLGSSEAEVKKSIRDVFHRGYKKNTDYTELNSCYNCPRENGGFTLESHMQHYDYLRNFFLSVNYVCAIWFFDKNGVLTDLRVSHEWDGV